jgi:hypothetical protein
VQSALDTAGHSVTDILAKHRDIPRDHVETVSLDDGSKDSVALWGPRTIVLLEELGQLKNPMNSSGYEPATFRLVALIIIIKVQ